MSKYTTEVRFICEHYAGLNKSEPFNSVNDILDKCWDKIFTTNCEFYVEEYRPILCKKILKHYYTREIGAETVGLWKLWVNTKLEEIMPYYNNLYKSALIDYNPLHDTEINTIRKTNNSTNLENKGNTKDLYSDTPQGSLNGIDSERYLTDARKIISDSNTVGTDNENMNETITGKRGTLSFSEMILKYRKTLINIDNMIIEEFSELFMNIW